MSRPARSMEEALIRFHRKLAIGDAVFGALALLVPAFAIFALVASLLYG